MLQVSLIWATTYLCTNNAITFWKEFVVAERGFSDAQVGASISIAAVASMPLVFFAGKLLDIVGRKRGAAIIFISCSIGIALSYGLHGQWPLTVALLFGIFGASAVLPVLNAFTTELFPTELRGDAFAWCNNLLGRVGYVLAPAFVGLAYTHVGSYGPVIQATTIFPIIALVLIYRMLPETGGQELEDSASID
jgi:putative MFS transporter